MTFTETTRVITFVAALLLGLIIGKVAVSRWGRRHSLTARTGEEASPLALLSYALLVLYVAAAQTGDDFDAPLTWKTVIGQAGVVVGAFVGVRDVFAFRRPHSRWHPRPTDRP